MTSLRYAWRSLRRSPGFVAMSVLALGLGLGLSTTMFAVMDAVVNPYIAYENPDRLVGIRWSYRAPLLEGARDPELFTALRTHATVFESVAAISTETMAASAGGENREIGVARVAPEYFPLMRVRPVLGRTFTSSDGPDVVVLSQALWRRAFGLRNQLEGASIFLGSQAYHVVGVLPRGADHPRGTMAWIPFPAEERERGRFTAVGRLRADATDMTVHDQIHGLGAILTARYAPAAQAPVAFNTTGLHFRSEALRDIHFAMVASAIIVLLIACANLAHLVLARGMARRGELALRLALGASRPGIVAQMLVECLAVTVAGSALGALLAVWGCDLLTNQMPPEISWVGLVQPRLSWRVFGWSAFAAAMATALFGLLPAVRVAMRVDMNDPLKDAASTTTARFRHRYNGLVIAEVALALVLMMSGALLVRTVHELAAEGDYGFDTRSLWKADVFIPPPMGNRMKDYLRRVGSTAPPVPTREQVLDAVRHVPGIIDAAFEGAQAPAGGSVSSEVGSGSRTLGMRTYAVVTGTYLEVLGLPAISGRGLQAGDGEAGMVAVIDPVAAAILYPGGEAVGRMLKLGSPPSDAGWVRILGVARNPRALTGSDTPPTPYVWVAAPTNAIRGTIVFRTARPDARDVVAVRRRLEQFPRVFVRGLDLYTYQRDATLASRRFFAGVFVLMGGVSLALAALGLYSVLAYAVSLRMREFGIRVALGAPSRRLYRMIAHDAAVMLLAGIGIGAVAAMLATRYVDNILVGIYRVDALSLVAAEVLLFLAGAIAAYVPARRAVRANPLDILRAV